MHLRRGILWAWFAGTLVLGAFTTGAHGLALPRPAVAQLENADLRSMVGPRGGVIHALYGACKCSERIVDSLIERRARTDVDEVVLLVGELEGRVDALKRAGYRLVRVTADELASRFRIEAAPLLVVLRPGRSVGYVGGYRETEGGPIDDVRLIDRGLAGRADEPNPLFGCAVSAALRRIVDPFGFKS